MAITQRALYETYINEIKNSLTSKESLANVEIKDEIDLLKNMFLESNMVSCLRTHKVYDETKQTYENYIAEYKIKNLMFIIIIPAKVKLLKNGFDPLLLHVVLKQNKIMFYDNQINFFMRLFPKHMYEQILQSNEIYKKDFEPSDYDTEIKMIMNQTNYTLNEAKEKFFKMEKSVENVILDYLGKTINEENIKTKSMNQNIYSEIRNFMNNSS